MVYIASGTGVIMIKINISSTAVLISLLSGMEYMNADITILILFMQLQFLLLLPKWVSPVIIINSNI